MGKDQKEGHQGQHPGGSLLLTFSQDEGTDEASYQQLSKEGLQSC